MMRVYKTFITNFFILTTLYGFLSPSIAQEMKGLSATGEGNDPPQLLSNVRGFTLWNPKTF